MIIMKCKHCESKDITIIEVYGAYDWWLYYTCNSCWVKIHRWTDLEIVTVKQKEEYWNAFFILAGDDWYFQYAKNFKYITQIEYENESL